MKVRGRFAYFVPVVLIVLFSTCPFVGCHEGTIDGKHSVCGYFLFHRVVHAHIPLFLNN